MGNKAGKRNTRGVGGGRRRSQILDGGAPKQSFAKKKRRGPPVKTGIVVPVETIVSDEVKPERNAPCPCGSDKKWKTCCGSQ